MRFVSVRFLMISAFVVMALAPCVAQAAVASPATMQMLPPTRMDKDDGQCDSGSKRVLVWDGAQGRSIKCATGFIVEGNNNVSPAKVTIQGLTTASGGLVLTPVAVDPPSPALGQIWVRSVP
ncbi:MAG: hypothetical protein WC612_04020 [Bdellovibrionales bacterium]|jgi:hypothetical protein